MNPILVIRATGTVGRQVVSRLVATGTPVRAMSRNPGAAQSPRQVEVVYGDLTLPETLDGCCDGVDTVFLVWTAPPSAVAPALDRITKRAITLQRFGPDDKKREVIDWQNGRSSSDQTVSKQV